MGYDETWTTTHWPIGSESWRYIQLAAGPPLGLRAMKEGIRRGMESTLAAKREHNVYMQSMLINTNDYKQGVAVLRERRTPAFEGY